MVKAVGALLTVGGCLKLALEAAGSLSRRVRALESWGTVLERLEGELAFRLPDMPRLLETLAQGAASPAAETLTAVRGGLEELGESSFEELWERAVTRENPCLSEEERQTLCRLGGVLGRYGWQEQHQAVERLRQLLAAQAETVRETLRKEGRLYSTLGLTLGLFLTIILL